MTKQQIAKMLAVIAAAYPNFEVSDIKIQVWHEMLADINYNVVQLAVKKCILENTFPPSIAELRKSAYELVKPDTISTSEAWGMAINAIRNYGHYQQKKGLDSLPPQVAKIVERMGWQEICFSENISVVRGQFVKMYEEEKERDQKLALMPPDVREYIKAKNKSILSLSGGDGQCSEKS